MYYENLGLVQFAVTIREDLPRKKNECEKCMKYAVNLCRDCCKVNCFCLPEFGLEVP